MCQIIPSSIYYSVLLLSLLQTKLVITVRCTANQVHRWAVVMTTARRIPVHNTTNQISMTCRDIIKTVLRSFTIIPTSPCTITRLCPLLTWLHPLPTRLRLLPKIAMEGFIQTDMKTRDTIILIEDYIMCSHMTITRNPDTIHTNDITRMDEDSFLSLHYAHTHTSIRNLWTHAHTICIIIIIGRFKNITLKHWLHHFAPNRHNMQETYLFVCSSAVCTMQAKGWNIT